MPPSEGAAEHVILLSWRHARALAVAVRARQRVSTRHANLLAADLCAVQGIDRGLHCLGSPKAHHAIALVRPQPHLLAAAPERNEALMANSVTARSRLLGDHLHHMQTCLPPRLDRIQCAQLTSAVIAHIREG